MNVIPESCITLNPDGEFGFLPLEGESELKVGDTLSSDRLDEIGEMGPVTVVLICDPGENSLIELLSTATDDYDKDRVWALEKLLKKFYDMGRLSAKASNSQPTTAQSPA